MDNNEIIKSNNESQIETGDMVEIDLRDLFKIIRAKWYYIAGITIIALFLAGFLSYISDPVYESTASIIIEGESGMRDDFFFGGSIDTGGDKIENRMQIIKSPLVINKAIELLDEKSSQEAIPDLDKRISVNNISGTDLIEINVKGLTPEIARDGAWAVSTAYQQYRQARAREQSSRVLDFLLEQVNRAEEEVDRTEQAVRNYQNEVGIISLDNEASKINNQLSELENQLLRTDISIRENEMELERINERLEVLKERLPDEAGIVTDRLIERLQVQLAELEAERIDYLNRGLGEDTPEINSLNRRIINLEESIREYSRRLTQEPDDIGNNLQQYRNLLSERISLEAKIAGQESSKSLIIENIEYYENELRQLSDKNYDLARLKRDVEVANNTYKMLSEEVERSRIAVEREVSDVQIVHPAKLPEVPVSPRILLNLIIAGFLGVFAGTGLVFLIDFMDTTVKEEKDIEKLIDVPVLGVIPDIELVDHSRGYGNHQQK